MYTNILNKEEENLLININESSIFNSKQWSALIEEQYGFRKINIQSNGFSERNYVLPFLEVKSIFGVKKLVLIPFSDYYPISENDEIITEILDKAIDYSRKNGFSGIEIRNKVAHKLFISNSNDVIHLLPLTNSMSGIENNFSKMHKRNIKSALKSNLTYKVSQTEKSFDNFYNLHLLTRRKKGVPIQPKKFLKLIYDKFVVMYNKGLFIEVYFGNICIASALFLASDTTFTYKFGASNPDYLHLRPNHLLFSEAIKYAQINTYKIFDFGKTEIENKGLREFKLGWGSKEIPLHYSYYPVYNESKFLNRLKNTLLKQFISHSPKFVCKILGELIYKYAA